MQLKHASDLGFSIVLDDFGTSYSSIPLLEKLPLSKAKLDHAFVCDAMETEHGKKLLSAIHGLLQKMNLRCCVEGIENSKTQHFVTSRGCQEVQGYYIGVPEIISPRSRDC